MYKLNSTAITAFRSTAVNCVAHTERFIHIILAVYILCNSKNCKPWAALWFIRSFIEAGSLQVTWPALSVHLRLFTTCFSLYNCNVHLVWWRSTYIAQLWAEHKAEVHQTIAVVRIDQIRESECHHKYQLQGCRFLEQSNPCRPASLRGIF